jgi:hypothetical protein
MKKIDDQDFSEVKDLYADMRFHRIKAEQHHALLSAKMAELTIKYALEDDQAIDTKTGAIIDKLPEVVK